MYTTHGFIHLELTFEIIKNKRFGKELFLENGSNGATESDRLFSLFRSRSFVRLVFWNFLQMTGFLIQTCSYFIFIYREFNFFSGSFCSILWHSFFIQKCLLLKLNGNKYYSKKSQISFPSNVCLWLADII